MFRFMVGGALFTSYQLSNGSFVDIVYHHQEEHLTIEETLRSLCSCLLYTSDAADE